MLSTRNIKYHEKHSQMSPERTFVEKRYRFLIIVSSRHESKAPEEPASQPPLTRGHRRPPPCAGSHSPEGEKGRESGGVGWGSWATAQGGAFAPAAGPNWSGSIKPAAVEGIGMARLDEEVSSCQLACTRLGNCFAAICGTWGQNLGLPKRNLQYKI